MRVVIKFATGAHAELLAELERIPQRERAERLRLLASIGLMFMRSELEGAPTNAPRHKVDLKNKKEAEPKGSEQFRRVQRMLRCNLLDL